jgi:hypothetical protein
MTPSFPLRQMFETIGTKIMKPVSSIWSSTKITTLGVRHKKYVMVLCLILLISPSAMGTTILVVLHGGTVWIAADSLQTANGGQQRYACKINFESGFYWAASSPLYEDEESGYSIQDMVAKSALTKGRLINVLNALIAKAKIESAKELTLLKRSAPEEFAKLVQPDHSVLVAKVVFVGKGNGHAPEVVYTVLIAKEIAGEVVVSGTPIDVHSVGNFELGSTYTAQDYFLAHASSIKDDPVQVINDSIIADEKAHPLRVGGNVSILRIGPQDAAWERKGECQ